MDALADLCCRLGSVNLIIIDPIVAVATKDSHKNAETRRGLQPVVDIAERTAAAVLGVHHLTKRSEDADPVDRVSGSLAFGAGPRVVLMSALDRRAAGETRGVLMRAKNNIGRSHGGIVFTAETRPLAAYPDIEAQRILWGQYVDKSARDILEEIEGKEDRAERKKRKAVAFLSEALASALARAGRGFGNCRGERRHRGRARGDATCPLWPQWRKQRPGRGHRGHRGQKIAPLCARARGA